MTDPLKRYKNRVKQHEFNIKNYPEFFGDTEVKPQLGIGVATVPKLFGCRIEYYEDHDPYAHPLMDGNDTPPNKLPVEDNINWLLEEIDTLVEAGFDKRDILMPDLQGPLNLSFKVAGDRRMMMYLAGAGKKDKVEPILNTVTDAFIEVHRTLRKELGRPQKMQWTVSGCTYYYINPRVWKKFILPNLYKCRRELGDIRLHHCGEATASKIEVYAEFPWIAVELGFGSDLKTARRLFINPKIGPLPFSCRISPFRIHKSDARTIYNDVMHLINDARGGPVTISCVGVPYGTPDENLKAMLRACEDYNRKKMEEEEEE